MRLSRPPFKFRNQIVYCALATAAAALLLSSGESSAAVIFSGDWPQQTANPVPNGTAWTYSNVSTDPYSNDLGDTKSTIQTQQNSAIGFTSNPPDNSTYCLTENIKNGQTDGPVNYYVTSTAADDLGSFQPNTTYTLSFYSGDRTGQGWDSDETLTAEITDGIGGAVESDPVVVTLSSFKTVGTWYQFTTSFTTGSVAPSGNVTIEFLGYQPSNVNGNDQMTFTDYSLSAISTPEPQSLCLLGMFGVGALARPRRARVA